MKYIILSIFGLFFLSSCESNYLEALPELTAPSKPAGGVYKCTLIENDGSNITLEADFYAVNGFGVFIQSLSEQQITMQDENGTELSIISSSLNSDKTTFKGDFSALMLFDDSGSISGNDPDDDRVKAGKAMTRLLRENEEVAVSRFSTSISNNFQILSPFTTDTSMIIPLIEELIYGESGGTPLYYSMDHMLDTIDQYAANENRALIAFTDGADTYGRASIPSIIEEADSLNIPVYTIGLGTNTDLSELAQIAYQTGGAVMLADDAIQLIALYTSLADLLRGGTNIYKLRITIPSLRFNQGSNNSFVTITLPDGEQIRLQLSFNL